jgi:hypothetical protein
LVLNTFVEKSTEDEATAVSDVVLLLLRKDSGWTVGLVGRYTDTLHHTDGGWRFHHRAADFVT